MKTICLNIVVALSTLTNSVCYSQERSLPDQLREFNQLLSDEVVRWDLELSDEQAEKLKSLTNKSQQEFSKLANDRHQVMIGKATSEEKKIVEEKLKEAYESAFADIKSVLLPHQVERIGQLKIQSKINSLKDTSFGVLDLVEEMDLTSDQVRKLKEFRKQTDKEFAHFLLKKRREISEKRSEMKTKLLAKLSVEQRSSYEKLVGQELLRSLTVAHWFTSVDYVERLQKKD